MVDGFSIPEDLYFWRQNRLGSFLPMLGWLFFGIGFKPIIAISLAQVALLSSIFWMYYQLLNKSWLFVLVPLALLFPIYIFADVLYIGHPYMGHLFFFSLLIFIVKGKLFKRSIQWFLLSLVSCLMFWTSEISITNLAALPLLFQIKGAKFRFNKKIFFAAMSGFVLGFAFVVVAKSYAYRIKQFNTLFASPSEFINTVTTYAVSFFKHLDTWEMQVWLVGMMGIITLILVNLIKSKRLFNRISTYFFVSAFFSLGLVLISYWAVFMHQPFRYFCPFYIQLLLAFVFLMNEQKKVSWYTLAPISLVVIAGAFSYIKHYQIKTSSAYGWLSRTQAMSFAKDHNNIGIIGSYWNTYIIESFNTSGIDSSPHDKDLYRGEKSLETIFTRDSIMLIENAAFETLPDTIEQFGALLIKTSNDRHKDEFNFAFYKVAEPYLKTLKPEHLDIQWGKEVDDLVYFGDNNKPPYPWVISGPNFTLPKGKYEVCYKIKYQASAAGGNPPDIRVSYSFDRFMPVKKNVEESTELDYQCIEIELDEVTTTVQCKLFYHDSGELYFEEIRLRDL
jgi:hypothetical protein